MEFNSAFEGLTLKLYFSHTICHNFEMFRTILSTLSELLNINKAYRKQQTDQLIH